MAMTSSITWDLVKGPDRPINLQPGPESACADELPFTPALLAVLTVKTRHKIRKTWNSLFAATGPLIVDCVDVGACCNVVLSALKKLAEELGTRLAMLTASAYRAKVELYWYLLNRSKFEELLPIPWHYCYEAQQWGRELARSSSVDAARKHRKSTNGWE